MSNKRQYSVRDFRLAIEKVGSSPAAIAKEVGCTRGTVYKYMRAFPELKEVYSQVGGAVDNRGRFSVEAFREAIRGSHGVKAAVAAAVGCSRSTVDKYLAEYPELAEALDEARSGLVAAATSALVRDVMHAESDDHHRAYMFVLKTFGKDEGFTERQEITGADGAPLLSTDDRRLLELMGLDETEVVRQFRAMLQMRAAQMGLKAGKGDSVG